MGKGWHKGNQTALGFLPPGAAHNDFIFSVIAEEKGFVGSMVVLTLYGMILFTGLRIAGQARDRLGKLLAVGVVALLFSHVFINIGMNIRLVPVTGIPLPLLSYGGSSVIGSLIAIGILHASEFLRDEHVAGRVFVGELSLDGSVSPIRGALSISAALAGDDSFRELVVPLVNANEAVGGSVQGLSARDHGHLVRL